jgi:hypothetical protein
MKSEAKQEQSFTPQPTAWDLTKPAKAKDKQTARFRDRLGLGCKYCKAIEHQKVLSGIVAKSDRCNQGTLGPLDPQIGVSDSDPATPIDPSKTFNRT